ncbi:MAG: hypothetical protein ACE5FJ_00485 [Gemmatimonadales bacterium]
MRFKIIPLAPLFVALQAAAQTNVQHIALGDSLYEAMEPAQALEHYRAAFDVSNYEMLWKFAQAQIDVAKQLIDDRYESVRDSLYGVARLYAEAAVAADSLGPDGHFMLALAIGRLSRTKGGRERVRFGRLIYQESAEALRLDPMHAGAHHVIGVWHAEIRRLSGLTRTFARALMGADFMRIAAWDSAVVHLERAVEIEPSYIFHRLELAEVYVDLDRYADARRQLRALLPLEHSDVNDGLHQARARELLQEIADR